MARYRKMIVALIAAVGAAAALVVNGYNPSFTQACIALVGPVFGVIAVFASKNHSIDDLSKAVSQLQAAAITIVGYFATIPTDTGQKITILVGSIVSVIAVFWVPNEGSPETTSRL
jgi:hypothetical protein